MVETLCRKCQYGIGVNYRCHNPISLQTGNSTHRYNNCKYFEPLKNQAERIHLEQLRDEIRISLAKIIGREEAEKFKSISPYERSASRYFEAGRHL